MVSYELDFFVCIGGLFQVPAVESQAVDAVLGFEVHPVVTRGAERDQVPRLIGSVVTAKDDVMDM